MKNMSKVEGKGIITVKRTVWLRTDLQPATDATITEVEESIFWVNLPRDGNQVLVLQENQEVKLGISLPDGFYSADTTVAHLGNDPKKFYGLKIPEELTESQERRFIRAHHSANVLFRSGDFKAQTAMVNFSAGGIMVYLVPELEKVIQANDKIMVQVSIDNIPFEVEVKQAWQKNYANIPFAGFEFINISSRLQAALAMFSLKYSEKQ